MESEGDIFTQKFGLPLPVPSPPHPAVTLVADQLFEARAIVQAHLAFWSGRSHARRRVERLQLIHRIVLGLLDGMPPPPGVPIDAAGTLYVAPSVPGAKALPWNGGKVQAAIKRATNVIHRVNRSSLAHHVSSSVL